jgi:hypothetical protein
VSERSMAQRSFALPALTAEDAIAPNITPLAPPNDG